VPPTKRKLASQRSFYWFAHQGRSPGPCVDLGLHFRCNDARRSHQDVDEP
jgi:hypothetical protein